MSTFGVRAMAIGLAALIALALPALAKGGGGGHGRGGGGHFRSGGAPRIHARSFARPAFRSRKTFAHRSSRGHRLTTRTLRTTTSRAAITRSHRAVAGTALTNKGVTGLKTTHAGRTIRPFVPPTGRKLLRAGAHSAMAAHNFRRADWRRYRHRYGWYAWAGPVFWPYAYYDLFDDIFWYYGPYVYYDDLFWGYGYGDILYGGLFAPYSYGSYAYWRPSRARRDRTRGARTAGPSWSQMCGEDSHEIAGGLPIDRIRDAVQPNDAQRTALDGLASATDKAAQIVKEACPTQIAITSPGRLEAMEQRLQAMAQAVDVIRSPLETFYNSLSDEQKERFNEVAGESGERRRGRQQRPLTQTCDAAPEVTEWPQAQIEQAVRPTEEQRASLARLKDAAATAADKLKSTCLSELPTTPPARLAAVSDRISAMLQAVRTVRTALNEFYGSLSDEQKARFNTIGKAQASRQGRSNPPDAYSTGFTSR